MPDPDLTRVPDGAVELPPRLQMRQVLISREPVQRIEVAPVLDQYGRPPEPLLEAQAAQFGMPASTFSILGIAVATGSHLRTRSGWLKRIPIKKTTKSPSMSAV